jgi:hypothetical protein
MGNTTNSAPRRRRRWPVTVCLVAVQLASIAAWDAAAPDRTLAWGACDGQPYQNMFLGRGKTVAGLKGVYSEIEFYNERLCIQGANPDHSWSLSWISLDGINSSAPGIEIYQGGYAKCPIASVGSCPWNNGASYYWYFYGREQGTCGVAFNTGVVKVKGNATAGVHEFQISKVGSDYNYYIDHVVYDHRTTTQIETCWGHIPQAAEWQNEMLDPGDQAGGQVSNKLTFGNNKYQDAGGWKNDNRPLGSQCDANSQAAVWGCTQASNVQNYFNAWDRTIP